MFCSLSLHRLFEIHLLFHLFCHGFGKIAYFLVLPLQSRRHLKDFQYSLQYRKSPEHFSLPLLTLAQSAVCKWLATRLDEAE